MKRPPDPMLPSRLKRLREEAGITSYAEAARRYRINESTYKHAANGRRGLAVEAAEPIARYHRVPLGWLLRGEGAARGTMMVPLLGRVGAGQEMMLFDDHAESVESFFDSETTTAFEVQGDSMLPVARDRDIAFFGPEQRNLRPLLHHECIVLLEDGRRFFKILQNGSKSGLYSLASYNGSTIPDVEVHSAGLFLGVKRR